MLEDFMFENGSKNYISDYKKNKNFVSGQYIINIFKPLRSLSYKRNSTGAPFEISGKHK
jgi:hypothetical protein